MLQCPVYELLGGPQKEKIFCYASNTDLSYGTENSIEWFLELGFKAVKLFARYGPESDIEGIRKTEELVARTREQIGDDVELMLDAWMSFNVDQPILARSKTGWTKATVTAVNADGTYTARTHIQEHS